MVGDKGWDGRMENRPSKREQRMREFNTGPKKIIVDIDNTLWNLAPVLWEHLKQVNPQMPSPDEWGNRESIERYLPLKEFFRVLKIVHMQQETYAPFPESESFLGGLKERGLHIIIASHRSQDALRPTANWLVKNRLVYDELHLSYDKSVLFTESWALVDDSPLNLDKAWKAGMVRAGLLFSWNAHSGHPLFLTLTEVLGYLDSELSAGKSD
jgi:hypothetical protein